MTGCVDVNNSVFVDIEETVINFIFYLVIVVTSLLTSKHKQVIPEAGGGCVGDIDGQRRGQLPALLRGAGQGGVTCRARH